MNQPNQFNPPKKLLDQYRALLIARHLSDSRVSNYCATPHRRTYDKARADKHHVLDNVLAF